MKIDEKALAKKIGRNLTDLLISRGRTQLEVLVTHGDMNESVPTLMTNSKREPTIKNPGIS